MLFKEKDQKMAFGEMIGWIGILNGELKKYIDDEEHKATKEELVIINYVLEHIRNLLKTASAVKNNLENKP